MKKSRTIFMTGATSGLGKVSALKAAAQGDTLIILSRSQEGREALLNDFKTLHPNASGKIEFVHGNLNNFKSFVAACQEVKAKFPVLDMIVNNAGIMNFEFRKTVDGIEETLQVNLLSPLLICHLLFEPLKKAKSPKIIFTASALHQGNINFDNLEFQDAFTSFKVYRQSKLGVILICRLLAERLKKHGMSIYSQHPGMVRTELGRNAGWFSRMIFFLMGKSPEKGSQTLTYLMETSNSALKPGEYYADKRITQTTPESYDLEVAKKLLKRAREYLGEYLQGDSPIFEAE